MNVRRVDRPRIARCGVPINPVAVRILFSQCSERKKKKKGKRRWEYDDSRPTKAGLVSFFRNLLKVNLFSSNDKNILSM